ncbi:MAG: hypothetical protein Kow0099_04400 [Candidatus Abyssubacteria bacterium]
MVHIDTVLLLAFGVAFALGICLAGVGVWMLWRKIGQAKNKDLTGF